jgi:hypothetical protein
MLGGGTGVFGQLMQQAMQGAKGGGGALGDQFGGQGTGGAAGVAGGAPPPTPAGAAGQPALRDNAIDARDEQSSQAQEPQQREPLHRAEMNDRAAAGPSEHGQAPVKSPEHKSHEDLGRNL